MKKEKKTEGKKEGRRELGGEKEWMVEGNEVPNTLM